MDFQSHRQLSNKLLRFVCVVSYPDPTNIRSTECPMLGVVDNLPVAFRIKFIELVESEVVAAYTFLVQRFTTKCRHLELMY